MSQIVKSSRGSVWALVLGGAVLLAFSATAESETTDPPEPAPMNSQGGLGRAAPGIESLLHLPSGFNGSSPRTGSTVVAGASESEWRRRFKEANKSLAETRAALEQTKVALDGAAETGGANQWSVAPPSGAGGGNTPSAGSPLSFKLRQALKKHRVELEASKRSMKELTIEADLAGVPVDWRGVVVDDSGRPPSEVGQLLD